MLEIKNLSAVIDKKQILTDISLKLIPHTLTAVIGKNGCGKSTLVSCINQRTSYMGEILFSGRNVSLMQPKERACLLSILPQALTAPHITVEELVKMGRSPYIDIGKHFTQADKNAVTQAISTIGIDGLKNCFIDEISGGERQKAYLAMTLAQDTRVMILDEPTTYMDMAYEHAFMALLDELKKKHKKTLLVIMHNLNQAIRHADRIAVMDSGSLVFDGSTEDCLGSDIIESTFGVKRYKAEDSIFFAAE